MRKLVGVFFFVLGVVLVYSTVLNLTVFLQLLLKLLTAGSNLESTRFGLAVARGLAVFLFGLLAWRSFRAAFSRFKSANNTRPDAQFT